MRDYEPKHIVLAISIAILVISPIILLILPTAVINTIYHSRSQLVVYVTSASYLVYGAALLFFFLSVFVFFLLWGRKIVIFVSLICLTVSILTFSLASKHYISVGTDQLAYRFLFSSDEHVYRWNEVERAIYYEDDYEEIAPTYEFFFNDGESVKLPENDYLKEYKHMIHNLLKAEDIEIEEKFYHEIPK